MYRPGTLAPILKPWSGKKMDERLSVQRTTQARASFAGDPEAAGYVDIVEISEEITTRIEEDEEELLSTYRLMPEERRALLRDLARHLIWSVVRRGSGARAGSIAEPPGEYSAEEEREA